MVVGAEEITRQQHERERRRKALERQIAELREQFEADDAALKRGIQEANRRRDRLAAERAAMAKSRQAFAAGERTDKEPKKERRR